MMIGEFPVPPLKVNCGLCSKISKPERKICSAGGRGWPVRAVIYFARRETKTLRKKERKNRKGGGGRRGREEGEGERVKGQGGRVGGEGEGRVSWERPQRKWSGG